MAQNQAYIEYPVACAKAGISVFAQHAGKRNSLLFDGHSRRCLEFVTLAARLNKSTGLYEGVLRFRAVEFDAAAPAVNFAAVLFGNKPADVTPAESELD